MAWTPDETGMEEKYPGTHEWLCEAGHLHEDVHCPHTGQEPPWGCPCSGCQEGDQEDWEPGDEEVS